jgi:hypothetical protein
MWLRTILALDEHAPLPSQLCGMELPLVVDISSFGMFRMSLARAYTGLSLGKRAEGKKKTSCNK